MAPLCRTSVAPYCRPVTLLQSGSRKLRAGRKSTLSEQHRQVTHEFQFHGALDDPVEDVARKISLAATGTLDRPASDQLLKESRIQRAP